MKGPWDDYAKAPEEDGPWSEYAATAVAKPPKKDELHVNNLSAPIRPRPQNAAQAVLRLGKDTLETITPPLSLEAMKRLVSPRVGQYGLSRTGQEVASYGQSDFNKMGENFSKTKFGQNNPKTTAVMRFMGSSLLPSPEDMALGAGVGEILSQTVGRAGQALKTSSARRALGATQSDLQASKSWKDSIRKQARANRAADEMLDRGLISESGSTSKTLENVQKLRSKAANDLNTVLSGIDNAGGAIDTTELVLDMEKALRPVYPDEKAAFNKIVEDIASVGDSVPLVEAKTRLKPGLGKSWDSPPTGRAIQFNRRAERFLENQISKKVAQVGGKEAATAYRGANRLFGNTETALNTLAKQNAREMGNALPGVRATVGAAGALAGGAGIPQAAVDLGLWEATLRRGAGIRANLAHSASKIAPGVSQIPQVPFDLFNVSRPDLFDVYRRSSGRGGLIGAVRNLNKK